MSLPDDQDQRTAFPCLRRRPIDHRHHRLSTLPRLRSTFTPIVTPSQQAEKASSRSLRSTHLSTVGSSTITSLAYHHHQYQHVPCTDMVIISTTSSTSQQVCTYRQVFLFCNDQIEQNMNKIITMYAGCTLPTRPVNITRSHHPTSSKNPNVDI